MMADHLFPTGIPNKLRQQLSFILESDKLKTILRQSLIISDARRENDAEHSWSLALMAVLLEEYSAQPVQLDRVVKMALIHDMVEIDAGDTFAYDEEGYKTKGARELAAAKRIFGLLPQQQADQLRQLWEEFEAMETPEARYAAALDRLHPFLNNYYSHGYAWRKHGISRSQVYSRMDLVRQATPDLWGFVTELIDESVRLGNICEDDEVV